MRIELLPVLLGALAALIGGGLVVDAFIPDGSFIHAERRRRDRPSRNRTGEALLGVAIVLIGAALIGRDQWPYTTVSIMLAVVLGAAGVVMNWRYLGAMAAAPARRSHGGGAAPHDRTKADEASAPTRDEERPASLG